MATLTSSVLFRPNLILTPPSSRFRPHHYYQFGGGGPHHLSNKFRGSLGVTRLGFQPDHELVRDLFDKAESLLYTIADAAVSSSDSPLDVVTDATTKQQNSDWFSGITNSMETILKVLKGGLSSVHVPYSYGFAIILLTVLVKAATFPLTKKQVESAMSMRSLQPQIKAIQERYAGDQQKIQLETARLYKLAGVNPLAGCLPTLATIPVWIGLYRALSNVADEGLLTEGFFWIPSLAGPTTTAARQSGSSISWLFPFKNGQPPLGWSDTLAYLVLPLLLVIAQYISVQIMQSSQNNDPNMKNSQAITNILPLMIGYFALSVPSGLSLYWLTNNILSTAQQVWLQKLARAEIPVQQFNDDMIKEDEKSVPELKSIKKEAKLKEETASEESRRGERFKQLKEMEARKRQQREEEKRKSDEAAAQRIEITNVEQVSNVNVLVNKIGAAPNLIDETVTSTTQDFSNGGVINGVISHEQTEKKNDDELQAKKSTEEKVNASNTINVSGASDSEDHSHQASKE
ncbi:hypothetical protein ACFE04_024862 [Oxalis oulophora]